MILTPKRKYLTHKPVKQNKAGSGNSGASRVKHPGPKTYVVGSRVMVLNAIRGSVRMVSGNVR